MSSVQRAFNRAGQTYDAHCQLQQQTADTLLKQLNITAPANILDVGCGTGINTEKLVARFPHSNIFALDFSDQLLQKARERLTDSKVEFIECDFDSWQSTQLKFDIIYSNLALHWSVDFSSLLNKLIQMLNTNGVLAFTIPLIGTFEELTEKFAVRDFYRADEVCHFIAAENVLFNYQEVIKLNYSDSISALRSIKAVGTNFVKLNTHVSLRGKSFLNELNLNKLTYVIGYFVVSPSFRGLSAERQLVQKRLHYDTKNLHHWHRHKRWKNVC